MSAAEAQFRIASMALTWFQRAGFFRVTSPPAPNIRPTASWLIPFTPQNSSPYVRAADEVLHGEISIFGVSRAKVGASPDWNCDPLTGTGAPATFGQAIDVHSTKEVGNIKYLWELNRHLDLVVLAQAYKQTGDEIYLRGIMRQLEIWFDQCPYLMGPNWASGLEVGIRLINWSATWQLIGADCSPIFEGPDGKRFRERWLRSIYQHAHFVRGHYSLYSSANNHLIGEAAGVFIAACTWPFWARFEDWKNKAYDLLVRESSNQVTSDGVDREQSVSYQRFVLEFLILCVIAGRACGVEFPDKYHARVKEMLWFLASIMDAGGNIPMIGDSDDGCVLRLSREPDYCPYRSILATGALLFDEPVFAKKAGALDDQNRQLLGTEKWTHLLQTCSSNPNRVQRTSFPEGGYYILGTEFDCNGEIRLLVDAGPLGYLSIAAHGHADALAVVHLSLAGREFLIDPGTYTYHGEPQWREYFRGTRAHNTVTIDEQDQSQQGGNFMWLDHAFACCLRFEKGEEEDVFVGEHEGYKRLHDPVTHRREISRRGNVFKVSDTLGCQGHHAVEQWWHFSEDCDVTENNGVIHAENRGVRLRLTPGSGSMRLFHGSEKPIAGWVSRRFGVKVPSTSVCVDNDIRGVATLRTMIECFLG